MDGPREYHTKWRKSERERQILYDITYILNLKYDTNLPMKQKQIHGENRLALVGACGKEGLGVWD